jgi:predicted transposase YbfD/YdcC
MIGFLLGATDWEEIVEISASSTDILEEYLGEDFLGVPSHDTFSRFFSLVSNESLEKSFREVMQNAREYQNQERKKRKNEEKEVLAVDGKYHLGVTNSSALNIVSMYSTTTGMTLGQHVADKKINEAASLRELVNELFIESCIITGDALHCQKDSAQAIIDNHADYLLCVKGNQEKLQEGIKEGIKTEIIRQKKRFIDSYEKKELGHGRHEVRTCYACSHLGWLPMCGREWEGIQSFGKVISERTELKTGKTTTDERYFISSLPMDAHLQMDIMRNHWKIENNLHWQMDVSFSEDRTRMQVNQLKNIALIKKLLAPAIKAFEYKKNASMKRKMKAAVYNIEIRKKLVISILEFYNIKKGEDC